MAGRTSLTVGKLLGVSRVFTSKTPSEPGPIFVAQRTTGVWPEEIIHFPEITSAFVRLKLPRRYFVQTQVAKQYASPVRAPMPLGMQTRVPTWVEGCNRCAGMVPWIRMETKSAASAYSPLLAELGLQALQSKAEPILFWGARRRQLHKEMEALLKL